MTDRFIIMRSVTFWFCGSSDIQKINDIIFRSYVPEHVRTHRVLASSITPPQKKDLIAKRSDAPASHNWRKILWRQPSLWALKFILNLQTAEELTSLQRVSDSSLIALAGVTSGTQATSGRLLRRLRPSEPLIPKPPAWLPSTSVTFVCPRICVVATAERKLAERAGEAIGAATGGDCDRATCRRWNKREIKTK